MVVEQVLRRSTPVVINSFNQLTYLKNIVSKLVDAGFRNIYVLDQASSYPPLLSYLSDLAKSGDVLLWALPENKGPRFFFESHAFEVFGRAPFIYSDPDISWDRLAPNFLTRLFELGHKYRSFKVGPALALPAASEIKQGLTIPRKQNKTVLEWETQFWQKEVEPDVYASPLDTTFHLFIPQYYARGASILTGMRVAGEGFSVVHVPWYKTDPMTDEEYEHYLSTEKFSSWKRGTR